ncbi:PTPA-CTERM sorting domain-containing protein [Phormidium sp. FACHB-592]|uniref:PTPA-CTERM sorting domain-containing protein n=1 Tax=Stenomitos frigidus AS-A4 TaxID=2933935 RepID=A0ABV0KLI4_9CYAN|nr:PTPA-CTERM sorting domain-containing protein [Phormidium sp. FACHB-592]MBD2075059.1 PTPA-CTERM sorting domain-containing protein [Phormidium sp. FACHB-592]
MMTLTAPQQLTLGVLGAALLACSINNPAQAAVLFNNGAPNFQLAIESDFALPVEAGDDFTLTSSNDVTKITWSGLYAAGQAVSVTPTIDQFSVRIFEFLNDRPAVSPIIAFNDISVARASNPQSVFFYNYSFAPSQPFTLQAGSYLLSIVNNTEADASLNWFWAASNENGNDLGRFQPGDQWFVDVNTAELSFAIEGNSKSVPTPALLPGLIGLGMGIWRKRQLAAKDRSGK